MEIALQAVLPALKSMEFKTLAGKPTVKVYVGANEIRLIFADIILTKHNFRAIIAWEDLTKILGVQSIGDFIDTHIGHFLKLQLLTPKSFATQALKEIDGKSFRETRFLSKHPVGLNTATFIYGNKIAIISLNEKLSTGFLIEDIDVHNTMSVLFEELWESKA